MDNRGLLPALRQLLKGYLSLSDEILATATPQDSTLAVLSKDARYEKALQGLRLVAKHELLHLMQALVSWRTAAAEDVRSRSTTADYELRVTNRAKKVMLECLFLEPTMLLLEELMPGYPTTTSGSNSITTTSISTAASLTAMNAGTGLGPATPGQQSTDAPQALMPDHIKFCTTVQEICFQWLLNLDDLLPSPDVPNFRQHIFNTVSRALGALSCVALALVANPFLVVLKKLVTPEKGNKTHPDVLRAQTLRLCTGMQHVTLTFGTEEQLRQAVAFLEGTFPFNYTASIKKSQVHHALVDMVTKMLMPLVVSGHPHMCEWLIVPGMSGLMEWYAVISKYKDAVWSWMQKHDKHIRVGWLLATVLVCLLDSEKYSAARDYAADFLLKQLKNKEYRGLAVRCLVTLITSLLVRFGKAHAMPRPELIKLLDKVVRGQSGVRDAPCLLAIARKSSINTTEIQEMLSPWTDLAPDYVLGVLIDLLGYESPDCILAALLTAHHMLSTAPPAAAALVQGDLAGLGLPTTSNRPGRTGAGVRATWVQRGPGLSVGGPVDMLDLMRAGYHAVDLLGLSVLMNRFTAGLSKLWQTWHMLYGTPLAVVNPDIQRERSVGLSQFRTLLRLITYTRPESWVGMKPLEVLPGYLSHPELSGVAQKVLDEVMRSSPYLRNQVLMGVAAHCCAIVEDNLKALREGLLVLKMLIDVWLACVRARAAGEVEERSSPEAGYLDLHRLEGAVWASGLCCHDESVRDTAMQVLSNLRTLHIALITSPPYQPTPTPALLATHLSCLPSTPSHSPLRLMASTAPVAQTWDSVTTHPEHGMVVPRSKSATSNFPTLSQLVATSSNGRSQGSGPGAHTSSKPGHQHKNSQASMGSSGDGGGTDGQQAPGLMGGLIDFLDTDVTYMYDVLEQSGPDLVRAAYWDWGDFSDLWQQYLDPPLVISQCQELLASPTRDGDAKLRLTRLMIELAKTMTVVSPLTSAACLHELCVGRLARLAVRDKESGRMGLPQDTVESMRRAEAWRYAGAVAAVLPTGNKESTLTSMGSAAMASNIPTSTSSTSLSLFGSGTATTSGPRRGAPMSPAGLSMRDVMRCHVALAFPGSSPPSLQASSIMALGHSHPSHHELVLDELSWLLEECSGNKPPRKGTLLGLILTGSEAGEYVNRGGITTGKTRPDEAKRVAAHIMRLLAVHTPPEQLSGKSQRQSLRWRIQEWLSSTWLSLRDAKPGGEMLWDNVQVAYCFAAVVNKVAGPLCDSLNQSNVVPVKDSSTSLRSSGQATGGVSFRKAIYDTLSAWTGDALYLEKDYRSFVRNGLRGAVERARFDPEGSVRRDDHERELRQWSAALDHRARGAMAALLAGPVFDADSRRSQGPVLQWIDRLLKYKPAAHGPSVSLMSTPSLSSISQALAASGNMPQQDQGLMVAPGPTRAEVGKTALLSLLQSNLDMFAVYLDKSYDAHHTVSSTYFQALSEVYCTTEVSCHPHILISLILYKMVDPMTEVREDARHLLSMLADRIWMTQPPNLLPSPNFKPGLTHAAMVSLISPRRLQGLLPGTTSTTVTAGGAAMPRVSKAGSEGNPPMNFQMIGRASQPQPATSGLQSAPTPSTPRDNMSRPVPPEGSAGLHGGAVSAGKGGTGVGGEEAEDVILAWQPPDGGTAFSALLDTYQEDQHQMSSILAVTHPELSEELCEEMMTRALDCTDPSIQQPVLTSLTPWMNNLIIEPQWKGTWCERLLKSMYYVTQRHGASCPIEIQNLWCTLAALKDNVCHMLMFLVDMGMEAGQQDMISLEAYLAVAKRICLYLTRTHKQFTIDQLQMEVSKQIQESDASNSLSGTSSQPVEFEMLLGDLATPEVSNSGLTMGGQGLDIPWPLPSKESSSNNLKQTMGQQLIARAGSASSSRSSTAVSSQADSAPTHKHTTSMAPTRNEDGQQQSSSQMLTSVISSSGGGGGGGGPGSVSGLGGSGAVAGDAAGGGAGTSDTASTKMRDSGTSLFGGVTGGVQPSGNMPVSGGTRTSVDVSGGGGVTDTGMGGPMVVVSGVGLRASAQMRTTTGGRTLISRPELAMCLLSEVAFTCDEEFLREGCLPLLLHACCVMLDAESPLVYSHAALLLTALVHSVGSHYKEQAQEAGRSVDLEHLHQLVRFLQSMRGRRLWSCEDTTCAQPDLPSYAALSGLVTATAKALHWVDDLHARWAAHSMDWALHCCSRHLSGRSFQVFRALSPPLDAGLLGTLLLCLHICLDTSGGGGGSGRIPGGGGPVSMGGTRAAELLGPRLGSDCALEVLATLLSLVQRISPPSRLVMYPQVFWVALSLLHSHVVALYSAGLALLAAYMRNLNLHQSKVLNVLLAAAPGLSGHILLHASTSAAKMGRNSEKGGIDGDVEEPEAWTLGGALLQLSSHDTSAQRHAPLAVQQLMLRGLQVSSTLAATLHALADMAVVLEVQGVSLYGNNALKDTSNSQTNVPDSRDVSGTLNSTWLPDGTLTGSGGPYDSLRKHRMLRLDAHQALLGPSHSQLFITCLCVTLHALAVNNTSVTISPPKPEHPAAQAALARCLVCLSRACAAHGLTLLVEPLEQAAHVWADGGTGIPLAYPPTLTKPAMSRMLLRQLCTGMAVAFLPRYGPLLLHHCLDSLAQAQPVNKHLAVLQLMHELFSVLLESLQAQTQQRTTTGQGQPSGGDVSTSPRLPLLGPTSLRVLTHPSLLSTLIDKTQGVLAIPATDALRVVVTYTAERQRLSSTGGMAPPTSLATPTDASNSSWPVLARSGSGAPSEITRTLHPASVTTSAAVRRVIDTLGASVWRGHKVNKLLPHLGIARQQE